MAADMSHTGPLLKAASLWPYWEVLGLLGASWKEIRCQGACPWRNTKSHCCLVSSFHTPDHHEVDRQFSATRSVPHTLLRCIGVPPLAPHNRDCNFSISGVLLQQPKADLEGKSCPFGNNYKMILWLSVTLWNYGSSCPFSLNKLLDSHLDARSSPRGLLQSSLISWSGTNRQLQFKIF